MKNFLFCYRSLVLYGSNYGLELAHGVHNSGIRRIPLNSLQIQESLIHGQKAACSCDTDFVTY